MKQGGVLSEGLESDGLSIFIINTITPHAAIIPIQILRIMSPTETLDVVLGLSYDLLKSILACAQSAVSLSRKYDAGYIFEQ